MLYLVCAFVDTGHTLIAIPAFDWHLACITHAAMNLHHTIYNAVCHIRAVQFRHAGLVPVIFATVGLPRCVQREPLRRLNLDGGIGDHPLDSLAVGDGLTEGDTL